MTYIRARKPKELKSEELKWSCDLECFDFKSTTNVKPIAGIVGQERAMKALKIGVDLKGPGYNIFITGLSGTGKFSSVKKLLENIRPDCSDLKDYAYVNNFEDEDRPTLLVFPKGKARSFKRDLAATIKFLQENIPNILEAEPFATKKNLVLSTSRQIQEKLTTEFEQKLQKNSFTIGQVKMGEVVAPEVFSVIGNKPVHIQQVEEFVTKKKISRRKANTLLKKYGEFKEEFQVIMKQIMLIGKETQTKITDMEKATIKDIVYLDINELKKKYKDDKVRKYLEEVAHEIPENVEVFKGSKPAQEQTEQGYIIDYMKEYDVNIVLDNFNTEDCPVIVETSPTYSNIFGTIEKFSDGVGGWHADFTRIKAGSLLRANGGYLVLNIMDAFGETGVWKNLKRTLLYNKLEIQDLANLYQFSPSILQPESITINTKVILIGSNYIYAMLSGYEDDFNKIFKIKAEFDYEMKRTDGALVEYAQILKKLIDKEKLLEFDTSAIGKIAEFGARYAGEQGKLTTRFAYIADLAREANFWANDVGSKMVNSFQVKQAYSSMRERHSLGESKVSEMIEEGIMLIDTDGSRVGQINGLAVYGGGTYSFGKPTRITASVGLGNGSIINVERESGLSGNTHNKGVLIIGGYFRQMFGRRFPLSFSASLVFEQGYGMIDGDSASITEISVLLSAISEIPIKQNFAITGSVNQRGDIQPIGGVNDKIEGFFEICKTRGLNGKHSVIIPIQNKKDLMLNDEIVAAVNDKKFHIYTVSKVEEAVELLTGVKAGRALKNGHYEANTVFGTVDKVLREMRLHAKPPQSKTQVKTVKRKTTVRKKKQ